MQTLLISRGCNCGKYGADGDFGTATEAAVLAFQRRNGLEADGIVGNDTWQKLLGG
jgi:peptidoglycan hydrolase-like protein with peptidoglycan-binding domain